jgi:signal transduction histidine kinase
MGRLYWKFFFFFWLAQIVTSVGVGITIWLLRPEPGLERFAPPPQQTPDAFTEFRPPPPASLRPPSGRPPHPRSILPPMLPLLAGSVVSLLFAALLARYFSRPIRNLQQAFESAAAGKLETRVGAAMGTRKDELADLGAGFDRMAERLQGLVEGQRRLLHDVSHELRSPLARLQAAADLLRQQPERSADFAERIERDTERMDRLVGELLTLARLDAGITGNLSESVDLSEIIDDIAEDARFEAGPRHCRINIHLDAPVLLKGNRDLLHRAIENIVRNALRHAPENGEISIAADTEMASNKAQIRLDISDNGPGVAQADLDAIFEPFFRSASTNTFSGYGLGLAITRRIVEAHGGRVSAVNRAQGGLQVSLLLPA